MDKCNLLKEIDLFGQSMKLNFNKEKKFNSFLGGFTSLSIFFLIIAILFYLSNDLIYRLKPKVNSSFIYNISAPIINLYENDIIYGAYFMDKNFIPFDDPTYLTIGAQQFTSIKENNLNNPNYTKLQTVNCSHYYQNFSNRGFSFEFNLSNLNIGICINVTKDINIGGSFNTEYFSNVLFFIEKCVNRSNSSVTCKSSDEIEAKIKQGYFQFYYIDRYIDMDNLTNPIIPYFYNYFILLDPNAFKLIDFYFKKVFITSDVGLVFPFFNNQSDIMYDSVREEFDTFPTERILQFHINISKNFNKYQRYYLKIQDVFASLGGIINLCTFIGSFVIKKLNIYKMNEIIFNTIFEFENGNNSNLQILSLFMKNHSKNFSQKNIKKSYELENQDNQNIQFTINSEGDYIRKLNLNVKETKLITTHNNQLLMSYLLKYKKGVNPPISIPYRYIISFILCNGNCTSKTKEIFNKVVIASRELDKYLDYLEIIKLLQEFRKLKFILFSQEQLMLFNYLSKSIINNDNLENDDYSIKEDEKEENFERLFKAYVNITQDKNHINNKIVQLFDSDIKKVFDYIQMKLTFK